jgi:hypothetical protein
MMTPETASLSDRDLKVQKKPLDHQRLHQLEDLLELYPASDNNEACRYYGMSDKVLALLTDYLRMF